MSSRNEILSNIRQHDVPDVAAPGPFDAGILYDEPHSQFKTVLETIGGVVEFVPTGEAAIAVLESLPVYTEAVKACSLVPGIGRSTFDVSAVSDPHNLEDVDIAVMPGELAVAENGAVWVTTPDVRHRTLYFLVQHLALVVPRSKVVSNMHEAYERIETGIHPFGTWISGPSKTADIEQSLVKGAHGSRTLLVMLLDDAPPSGD